MSVLSRFTKPFLTLCSVVGCDTGQRQIDPGAQYVRHAHASAAPHGASNCCRCMVILLNIQGIMLIALQRPHSLVAPGSNLHLDILMGRDEELAPADFMGQGLY